MLSCFDDSKRARADAIASSGSEAGCSDSNAGLVRSNDTMKKEGIVIDLTRRRDISQSRAWWRIIQRRKTERKIKNSPSHHFEIRIWNQAAIGPSIGKWIFKERDHYYDYYNYRRKKPGNRKSLSREGLRCAERDIGHVACLDSPPRAQRARCAD
jgi:hypothetical protein